MEDTGGQINQAVGDEAEVSRVWLDERNIPFDEIVGNLEFDEVGIQKTTIRPANGYGGHTAEELDAPQQPSADPPKSAATGHSPG